MKYYLIAGERSGDLHGGNLIAALKSRDPSGNFRGFGGEGMKNEGMELVVHYKDMSFMGFVEVLLNIRTISAKMKQCRQDILAWQPDVVILIDYPGFNMRMASFLKKRGIKVFWYISPKIWAWNQSRALKLKESVDRMFVILPFEKDFYKKFDWEVDYVGNPVLDAVKKFSSDHHSSPGEPYVAILPGSRKQELERILPVLAEVCRSLNDTRFVVAGVSNLNRELYHPIQNLLNVTLVMDDTYSILSKAQAAIVTSGTATLETALFRVPQVVVYKTSPVSYAIARRVIQVKYISLVNLIVNYALISELIQEDASVQKIKDEVLKLLNDEAYRIEMLAGYQNLADKLNTPSASETAAQLMVDELKK